MENPWAGAAASLSYRAILNSSHRKRACYPRVPDGCGSSQLSVSSRRTI